MRKIKLEFFTRKRVKSHTTYFIDYGIKAGFPSPADDFLQKKLSLDEKLVKDKEATFYARVDGDSMIDAGLSNGDLLVIDKSVSPTHNKIAVCYLDGEFTVKRIFKDKEALFLLPENKNYSPIKIEEGAELIIWGIVTYVIKQV